MSGAGTVVRCENLVHVYGVVGSEIAALRGVDLQVNASEMVALLGPSGAGKSTLLWHLAGLLRPTAGTVEVSGRQLAVLSPSELSAFRMHGVGIVLQNAGRNLLPYLSVLDNLRYVQHSARRGSRDTHKHAMFLLDAVGIATRAHDRAGVLSGGELQRLALAVALANRPPLLLADEPTSQLDPTAASEMVELIRAVNTELGTTIVAVTHDPAVSEAFDRTVTIRDGRIGAVGFAGEEYVIVGRDGSLSLPPDLLEVLPPGSIARADRTDKGVTLRRIDFEDPAQS